LKLLRALLKLPTQIFSRFSGLISLLFQFRQLEVKIFAF
jgi:hypothetical protein